MPAVSVRSEVEGRFGRDRTQTAINRTLHALQEAGLVRRGDGEWVIESDGRKLALREKRAIDDCHADVSARVSGFDSERRTTIRAHRQADAEPAAQPAPAPFDDESGGVE